jgi:hypothetical protein
MILRSFLEDAQYIFSNLETEFENVRVNYIGHWFRWVNPIIDGRFTVYSKTKMYLYNVKVNDKPTNALIIQSIGTQYSPTCFGTLKCHHEGVKYDPA